MLNIIPFKQSDSSRCGPAVIKMILSYYHIDASEEDICKRCHWTYELGCTNNQMKEAIEAYGLECKIYNNSTLEDIAYWIKQDIPVIVDWFTPGVNPRLSDMPNGHSSIIVDIDKEQVYLLDPEIGKIRNIPRGEFMRVWFDWENTLTIQSWGDLVLRQAMIVYPIKLDYQDVDFVMFGQAEN